MRYRSSIGLCVVVAAVPSITAADASDDHDVPTAASPDSAAAIPPADAPAEPPPDAAAYTQPDVPPEPTPAPPVDAQNPALRQLPSMGGDQRLFDHPASIAQETSLPDRDFTAYVFADYWLASRPLLGARADLGAGGSAGPLVGASVGLYRSIEVFLGALYDTDTTQVPGSMMTTTGRTTRIAYGVTLVSASYAGFMLRGGITMLGGSGDTAGAVPTLGLALSLDARWLPFRIPNMRLRTGYPLGIGLEWGRL